MPKQINTTATWDEVLRQIERESELRGLEPSSTNVTLSTCRSFLSNNSQELNSIADPSILARLADALAANCETESTQNLIFTAKPDSGYKSRLRTLLQAYRALTGKEFQALLNELIKSSGISKQQLAAQTGLSPSVLAGLQNRVKSVTPARESIPKLDQALNAQGLLVSAYAAIIPLSERVSGLMNRRVSFGQMLRRFRTDSGLTQIDIVKKLAGTRSSALSMWERGICAPCIERREVVEQLDVVLNCNGTLLAAWEEGVPRKKRVQYSLPYELWPERAKREFERLMNYLTTNEDEHPRSKAQGWTTAENVKHLRSEYSRFFGYLVDHRKNVTRDDLTLALLCDWSLVKGWLDFINSREGRTHYQYWQRMFVISLRSLWRSWYRYIWTADQMAHEDPYWRGRLPTTISATVEIASGIHRVQTVELRADEVWLGALSIQVAKSDAFLARTTFLKGNMVGKAKGFIDAKVALMEVGTALYAGIRRLPGKIATKAAAIYVRKLAVSALSIVRAFRNATINRTTLAMVRIDDSRTVHLDLPGPVMKNRKRVVGPLPPVPWLHEILIRWVREARPLIVGSGADAGFLFTTTHAKGGRVSHNIIYNDTTEILGSGTHGLRYALATDGHRKGLSDAEIAEVLGHLPEMTRMHYDQSDAEDKNAAANQTAATIHTARRIPKLR
jgi:transcriptional regulator with XRE-family HTH domain